MPDFTPAFLQWARTISTKTTKVLVVRRDAEAQAPSVTLTIRGDTLEVVENVEQCLLSDTQSLNTRPHLDARDRSAWKTKTAIARTYDIAGERCLFGVFLLVQGVLAVLAVLLMREQLPR